MISGNTPIDVQAELLWYCKAKEIGFVHWVQDVYSQAIRFFLERKVGAFAAPVSYPFLKLEQWVATRADAAVAIAPAFADILAGWGVPRRGISVIENWAPLDEVRPLPRINEWSMEHGLNEKTVFLYSGTLGMKHRPDLLYHLAKSLKNNCKLVVVTEGIGREYLRKLPPLDTIQFLDFQPYDQLPMVLASADVLVATLESDAGQFAVPSKVLSYMCAGRPLLLAAPAINLAAAVVRRSRAGIVANPDSPEDVCAAAQDLSTDLFLRSSLGASARRYAEREFNISRIAFRFEEVLLGSVPARARVEGVVDRRRRGHRPAPPGDDRGQRGQHAAAAAPAGAGSATTPAGRPATPAGSSTAACGRRTAGARGLHCARGIRRSGRAAGETACPTGFSRKTAQAKGLVRKHWLTAYPVEAQAEGLLHMHTAAQAKAPEGLLHTGRRSPEARHVCN